MEQTSIARRLKKGIQGRIAATLAIFIFMTTGSFFLGLPAASAQEERKTMEELLVEKGVLSPEEAASVQGRKFSKWVDRLTFSGDFRLRHESFAKFPGQDRHRQRFRLRFGSDLKVGDFLVGVRLASGEGQQVSTNQSFDNIFTQKQIWIDRAFLQWRGLPGVTLTGGKMQNPFFTIYSTDIVWDDDVNPEGFAENFQLKLADSFVLFANFGQLVLDEDSGTARDQWLFGEQGGMQIGVGKAAQVTLAGAFYNFKNANVTEMVVVPPAVVQPGNTRAGGTGAAANRVVNPYRVVDLTAELSFKVVSVPVVIQGDFIKNLADTNLGTDPNTHGKDTGYQVGARIGRASDPQTWELAYYYKLIEANATLADINDSDFGEGGTNRKGHIMWVGYAINKAVSFRTKYFITRVENERISGDDDIRRLQVDLSMKF